MKYSCYQDCSVIHGWFVYCAFCWQMHRLSKSLEIRFRMTSFSKISLLTCPCLRRKRVENSQAILEHLMTFRSSISTAKPEQLLSLMCFFGLFVRLFFRSPKSSVWFMRLKFIHEQWSIKPTIVLGLKSLRFRGIFSYDFGCKQKALSDFLAWSSSWKIASTRKAGLKHK